MSMDLNFWKYKENAAHDHATVYQTACCDGEVMEVLEILPIDDILKKLILAVLYMTHKFQQDLTLGQKDNNSSL